MIEELQNFLEFLGEFLSTLLPSDLTMVVIALVGIIVALAAWRIIT